MNKNTVTTYGVTHTSSGVSWKALHLAFGASNSPWWHLWSSKLQVLEHVLHLLWLHDFEYSSTECNCRIPTYLAYNPWCNASPCHTCGILTFDAYPHVASFTCIKYILAFHLISNQHFLNFFLLSGETKYAHVFLSFLSLFGLKLQLPHCNIMIFFTNLFTFKTIFNRVFLWKTWLFKIHALKKPHVSIFQ